MKRGVLLTLDFPPNRGGVAAYYQHLCQQLPADQLIVVAPAQPKTMSFDSHQRYPIIRDRLLQKIAANKKRLPFVATVRLLIWSIGLRHRLKKYRGQLTHVGNVLPLGTVALFWHKLYHQPYIVYTHGLDVLAPQQSRRKKKLLIKILRHAHGIVANSYFTHDEIVKLGISKDKIVVAYPCPSLIPTDSNQRQNNTIDEDYDLAGKKILLSVGRLVDRKGFDQVIKALPLVKVKIPNLSYLIVGNGPARKKLQQLTGQLRLGASVQFLNELSDNQLRAIYQRCDLFILPTRQIGPDVEGFGIVFLEANGFAKPVIAGRSGGVPEAVLHEQTGLLVNPLDTRAIATAIIDLLTDPTKAQQLGLQGMRRIVNQFTWPLQLANIKPLLE